MPKQANQFTNGYSPAEVDLIHSYFAGTMTMMSLYERIIHIRPDRTYCGLITKINRLRLAGHRKPKEQALSLLRTGYLDIEATNLEANFGHILTWVIKVKGEEKYDMGIITKKEIFDYEFDKRIVKELLMAFANYDIIYTHYGADRRFDLPFIRTRALYWGMGDLLPKHAEKYIMDTWPIAKNKLKLHSNRLDVIARALNIKDVEKTALEPEIWQLARVGEPKALKYVLDHNKKDAQLLELVHEKLACVERPIYRSM